MNIIEKYKDEPFTQETYDTIQKDLEEAGLSPKRLATIEHFNTFNPTSLLLSILNGEGNFTPNQPRASIEDEYAAQMDTYMNSVVSLWQEISTTYGSENTPAEE